MGFRTHRRLAIEKPFAPLQVTSAGQRQPCVCAFVDLPRLRALSRASSAIFNTEKQYFMKKTWFLVILLFTLSAAAHAQKKGVFVSDAVVAVAQQMQVDYKGLVRKASAKDAKALQELFEFTRLLDGAALNDHLQTCLELIPVATDEVYAKALESRSSGLKSYLLKNMEAVQGRVQKESLKKPIGEWAPYTWEALNGREVNIVKPEAMKKNSGSSPTGIDAVQNQTDPQPGALAPKTAPDASQGNPPAPPAGRRGN